MIGFALRWLRRPKPCSAVFGTYRCDLSGPHDTHVHLLPHVTKQPRVTWTEEP